MKPRPKGLWLLILALFLVQAGPAGAPQEDDEEDYFFEIEPGLIATCTDGRRTVVSIVATPDFTLRGEDSIHPLLSPAFRAKWEGRIKMLRGGRVTFHDTGARVFIRGEEVQGRPIEMDVGMIPIRIEYERRPGPARFQLMWESDHFRLEPVPSRLLGHREAPAAAKATALVDEGRYLAEEFNCMACHAGGPKSLRGREAPDFSHVGSRAKKEWIAKWLENPRGFRAEAYMPAVIGADDRAHIAAYLGTLKDPEDKGAKPAATAAAGGMGLFERVGCATCHAEDVIPLEGLGSKYTAHSLAKYLLDPVAVDPSGRMPSMLLDGEEAAAIADHLAVSRNEEYEAPIAEGDPEIGREKVMTSGCLGCHTLAADPAMKNEIKAPAFAGIAKEAGCLAEEPKDPAARYGFREAERAALLAFVKDNAAHPDQSYSPVYEFRRAVRRWRCTLCHEVYEELPQGLAEAPPTLNDAGNKMRSSWLDLVLNQRKRVRPWMGLRMPHFGERNMEPMVRQFHAVMGAEEGEGPPTPKPNPQQVEEGIRLIGKGTGFDCISCHDYQGHVATGTRGPDMTEMFDRVRADWFRRWMDAPLRIQPGTAMPKFFADTAQAEADRMTDQLWSALSAGRDMPLPPGLTEKKDTILHVADRPLVVRTLLPGSSPRSIAVGLPGLLSYCFDAQECRVRYAWSGPFLDMEGVWTTRGGLPVKVLGERFYVAADLFPLRIGDPGRVPARRFRGYDIVEGDIVFRYDLDGVPVRQRISPVPGKLGLVYSFDFGDLGKDVWFLPGEPAEVKFSSSKGEWKEGKLKVAAGEAANFEVTVLSTKAAAAETRDSILVVRDKPILMRTFLPDTPPRSIAVGLVGGQSYCFDARDCFLRYAWKGAFLDVEPVWSGRGGMPARIMGERWYTAGSFPLRIGDPGRVPGAKFRGYRLIDFLPEFFFEVDGALVDQKVTATDDGKGLVLSFRVRGAKGDVYFVAAPAPGVKITSPNGAFEEGKLRIPAAAEIAFQVVIAAN